MATRERQQSSTTYPLYFLMVDGVDHITGKTGLTPTVTLSKNGAGYGAAAGAVSPVGNGLYAVAGNATDSNTLGELWLHATATGADPTDIAYTVVAYDPFATPANAADVTAIQASISGIAAAVWAAATRTLSAFGFTVPATVADKAGYSLAQAFPSNFSALGITAGGKVAGVVLADTVTTYTGDTPQTGDAYARVGAAGAGLTAVGDARLAHLNADVDSRMAGFTYAAPDNAGIALIKAKTDNLPALPASTTNITAGTVTAVAGDVGITQAAADKVWGSATRTLSSFGTLAADAAAAVWGATARTLSAFGFTVPATVADKAGYSLAASQHVVADTLGALPAAPADWLTAAAVKADAVAKMQGGLSTYAGGDTPGVATLLSRVSANAALASQIPAHFTNGTFASDGVLAVAALANAPTGGGSGGASAADVWGYGGTRSLTDKAGFAPSAAANASQARAELAAELARIDAAISSRNATAPDNAGIAAVKAKTDNLPASPAAAGGAMTLTPDYDAAKAAAPAATAVAGAVLDELLSAHTVAGSLARAVADAGAAGNPWDYAFDVPGSDPAATVTAGELQFQLFIPPAAQPVDVVPAPPHITLSRVYGTFELPDNTPAAKVAIQFDLVVPGDGPAKSDNIVATRQIKVTTNTAGELAYKGHLYVDLERNDYLTPAGTTWTITSAALGFDAAPFTLASRTFDLATLIA